jgi:hypothetical protein
MQRHAESRILQLKLNAHRRRLQLLTRDRSRPRDNRPVNGTYRNAVAAPVDPAVARARFADFVDRALKIARDNGMTDRKISALSGVATSTFHRWRTGEIKGLPKLPQVRAFCEAVGASVDEAMRVLGMTDLAPIPTPEPPLPRDVRIILRKLADPNASEIDKQFIRLSLQMLASRTTESRSTAEEETG